jgi:uncharacterized protein YyaL (SSP411 family)
MAPNRLAKETSPYLLQHANNPVDWYPWGEEALDRAVEENKPILLSIGYSACHWCHVMEHESFENPLIAELMNKFFVCIKVDREERPDLDQIYQNVAQALTRGGGWPLTVFLTPARRPFFGGTYFPPEDAHGRAGFKRVLAQLTKAYQTDPVGIAQNAMKLTAYIQRAEEVSGDSSSESAPLREPEAAAFDTAAEFLLGNIDWQNGGIGDAPKFPNAMCTSFLWRYGTLTNHEASKQAVLLTLRKMAEGGIYDQLGGGFSRYSVDATWSVPHFEKMLYDNGLLLKLYSEVLLSRDPLIGDRDRELFSSVVRGTVRYLLREMRSPDGAFFAAQDADSEGEEGRFFVWDKEDLSRILTDEKDLSIFLQRFGVEEGGNFEHGKTVLFLARSEEDVAQNLGLKLDEVRLSLARSTAKVFEVRSHRIPPGTDNKVLASWNGLVISGLSWASRFLSEAGEKDLAREAISAAEGAFRLVREKMSPGQDGKLFSTFQGGEAKFNGYLDDYAFMAMAALDLCRMSTDEQLVSKAKQQSVLWTKRVIRHFADKKAAGYFFTSDDHEELIHRPKSVFDQAIPSGISVTLECLSVLAEMDESVMAEFSKELEKQLFRLFPQATKSPFGCSELLSAALLYRMGPAVVSGPGSEQSVTNAFVFRKPADRTQGEQLILCHRRSCDPPYRSVSELAAAASRKIAGTSVAT